MINKVKAWKDDKTYDNYLSRLKAVHPKYYMLFKIGVLTGLRVSDVLDLRVMHGGRGGTQWGSFSVTEQKTGKHKEIRFVPGFCEEIKNYVRFHGLKAKEPLIFSRDTNHSKALSRVQAHRVLKRVALEMGIGSISTHSMRRTYARNHFRQYRSLELLQKTLNHKYRATTLEYLIDTDDLGFMMS